MQTWFYSNGYQRTDCDYLRENCVPGTTSPGYLYSTLHDFQNIECHQFNFRARVLKIAATDYVSLQIQWRSSKNSSNMTQSVYIATASMGVHVAL